MEVASVLAQRHRFDGEALGRSYLDLLRRGHARGTVVPALREGHAALEKTAVGPSARGPLTEMTGLIEGYLLAPEPPARPRRFAKGPMPDYLQLAARHQGGKNRKQFQRLTG